MRRCGNNRIHTHPSPNRGHQPYAYICSRLASTNRDSGSAHPYDNLFVLMMVRRFIRPQSLVVWSLPVRLGFAVPHTSACVRACLPACLHVCLPACLPACRSACPSACLPACLRAVDSNRSTARCCFTQTAPGSLRWSCRTAQSPPPGPRPPRTPWETHSLCLGLPSST